MNETIWKTLEHTFQTEAEEIRGIPQELDKAEVTALIQAMQDCKKQGRCILLSGCGTSGMAAKKIMHQLCCLEYAACFMPPSDALHGETGFLREGDLVLLFSKAGESEELDGILSIAKTRGAKTVAVTSKPQSPLSQKADLRLTIPIRHESDRYGALPTSSILNLLSVFDALTNCLIVLDDYQLSQLGAVHPGGAVGKAYYQGGGK